MQPYISHVSLLHHEEHEGGGGGGVECVDSPPLDATN